MNISKLTLTPIVSHARKVVIKNPTPQTANLLITERLSSSVGIYEKHNHAGKMPSFLKGLVNPNTYVGSAKKLK